MIDYKSLIINGSFAIGGNRFLITSGLVNAVARMWAINERNFDPVTNGTDTGADVPPL